MWIVIVAIVVSLAVLVWIYFATTAPTKGKVVNKSYNNPYTQIIFTGKTMVPIFHPESWNVTIQGEGGKTWTYLVSHSNYDMIQYGEVVDFSNGAVKIGM